MYIYTRINVSLTAIVTGCRYGCKALENIGSRSDAIRVLVAKNNSVQIMLRGLHKHRDDPAVQASGLHALAVLSGDDRTMQEHITQMSGAK